MSNKKPPRLKLRDGKYYVYYSEHGRDQRKSLRTEDLQTAEARFAGWLEQHRKEIKIEADPLVSDVLDYWHEQWITGQMLSAARYPSVINNLKWYFGNKRVSEVDRSDSREYHKLRKSGHGYYKSKAKDGTVRHELQKLRAAFTFMTTKVEPRERRISKDIIPYVDLPLASPSRNRVLNNQEIGKLREFCTNLVWQGQGRRKSNRLSKVGRFIMIAMETAQRKTAILELKWSSQIDFQNRLIFFLPSGRLQTIKKRPAVPISRRLLPVLERAYEEREVKNYKTGELNDLVCDSSTDVHESIKRVGEELEIPDLSAHVFRHTWATRAVMGGTTLEEVAATMGDTIETVRENYLHLSPEYLRNAVEQD